MNSEIKAVLEKCNEAYSKGEIYIIKDYEIEPIEKEFNIKLPTLFVDDSLYDLLYYCAKEKWPEDPFFKKLTSNNTGFGVDIVHEIPMGSMEELKTGDWDKWNKGHKEYWVSSKLDGCSVILTYENGKLKLAATRGHGIKGKDCTRHIQHISNIPKTIPYTEKVIIRGELLCPKADIPTMIAEVEKKTGQKLKNGRNTIAGALNKKDSMIDVFKYAHFVAYWDSLHYAQNLPWIQSQGFEIPLLEVVQNTITEDKLVQKIQDHITKSIYELDGIIITQKDNIEEGLETGTLNPKCSRKLKIGINISEKTTKLINVEWNVSKNGRLSPTVVFEPIELDGSVIQRATGVNKQFMENLGIYPGCTLLIRKAGAVIPQIVAVTDKKDDYTGLPVSLLPEEYTQEGLDLYTVGANPEADIKRLEYFGKKLEIEQLGYGNCHKLYWAYFYTNKKVLSAYELLELSGDFIIGIIGENGKKIVKGLADMKMRLSECAFADACGAFGPQIGEKVLQKVYEKYGTLIVTKDQLETVDGFGNARIEQYMQYLSGWEWIYNFAIHSLHISFIKPNTEAKNAELNGQIICFTGIRDKEFAKYLLEKGADVSDNWKSTTNLLVAKDPNGNSSKIKKAKEKGITILSLEEAYVHFIYKR